MAAIGQVVGGGGVIEPPGSGQGAVGTVTIANFDNPDNPVSVTLALTEPPVLRPPRPRYTTTDRPGRVGLSAWEGQDPYDLLLRVRLGGGYPRESVELQVRLLESFAEVPDGRDEPPVLTVSGSIPNARPNLKWRLVEIEDPFEQDFMPDGKRRSRYATRLVLRQHTTIESLEESLKVTKRSKGLRTRTTKVRPGERDLFAVSRRYYGDPSRASDIARANQMPLGARLETGKNLRMPA